MNNALYSKIYLWMFVGLLVSFVTGYYVSTQPNIVYNIFSSGWAWLIIIIEIGIAIFLSSRIVKMKTTTARILFLLYSFITGLTLSLIFVAYKLDSIILIFGVTSILFLVFAILGKYLNVNLKKMGTILIMMLVGIIIVSIVNAFIGSTKIELIVSIVGVIVFLGFISYDIRKIEALKNYVTNEDNLVILCAFELYLDFINLFYNLISLFGDSK